MSDLDFSSNSDLRNLLGGESSLAKVTFGSKFKIPGTRDNWLPTPAKTFSGVVSNGRWGLDQESAETSYSVSELTTKGTTQGAIAGTWYAQAYPYKMAFNANGGTGTMAVQTIPFHTPTKLTANAFTYKGKSFTGWNTKADGTGTDLENEQELTEAFTGNTTTTLYAQWGIPYTISFDANGGTGKMNPQIIAGKGALSANTFTKADYQFAEWNTQADGSGTAYKDQASISPRADMTLYAQWINAIGTLTYDVNGGNALKSSTQTANIGSTWGTLPTPTRKGYNFLGWYTDKDTWENEVTKDTVCNGDTTVYAMWGTAVEFPSTGGQGIFLITIIATMGMALGLGLIVFRKKYN